MSFLRSRMAKAMLAAVKECIGRMIDLNCLNQNGVAPVSTWPADNTGSAMMINSLVVPIQLHVAAANGYREAAMLLLDLGGANVNLEDNLGYTPLHIAAKYNQVSIVECNV